MEAAEDPRAVRTRRAIVESYVGLCAESGRMSATVADICRRAGVNRATFYRHFEDRADLLARGLELFFGELAGRVEAANLPGPPIEERVLARVAAFFAAVGERADFFRLLLSGAAGSVFLKKAERFAESFLAERRIARVEAGETARERIGLALPPSLAARALAASCMAFASWWLERRGHETPREIAALYLRFISRGLFETRP